MLRALPALLGIAALAAAAGCEGCHERADAPPVEAAWATSTPEPEADAGRRPPPAAQAKVTRATGKVEVSRQSGGWSPINVGDTLGVADEVRTLERGELELTVSEIRVRIHERSQLKVKTITDTALRARVKGRVDSQVTHGKGVLELEAEGSDAVIRSEGGDFSMSADGKGVVAVATTNGFVNLTAAGRSVEMTGGQSSRVRPGQSPESPTATPKQVLLTVRWPDRKETNRRQIPLAGRVEVGSQVLVQGRPVDVGEDGSFQVRVPLRFGNQRVAVTAVDPLGRRRQLDETIFQDDRLPSVRKENKLWQQ